MIGRRATYVDSSAIVKLVNGEPETPALRRAIRGRHLASSALARVEVPRAVQHLGPAGPSRALVVLRGIELLRINDRILAAAAEVEPVTLRSVDAIHLATAQLLGDGVRRLITYDDRMADAAGWLGFTVLRPS